MSVWHEASSEDPAADSCAALYHENSKLGRRLGPHAPTAVPAPAAPRTAPRWPFGPPAAFDATLAVALVAKPAIPAPGPLASGVLSACLASRQPNDLLEVHFNACGIEGLPAGLYRHHESTHAAELVRRGDFAARIGAALIDPAALAGSSVQIFVVGLFDRAFALHGERGYRLALMEAGARVRDLGLVTTALQLGLAALDFYDRELDAILGLDGLERGTLAAVAIGGRANGG